MLEKLLIPSDAKNVEKLYISGPMTGYPRANADAFARAAEELRAVGYEVFSPHEVRGGVDWSWADWLRADLPGLIGAQGVATLPDWQESRGAQLEVNLAQTLGMFVLRKGLWIDLKTACETAE